MGLILDSSILIGAERQGQSVTQVLEAVLNAFGNQEVAIPSVALVELAQGSYRANTPERQVRRQAFVDELLADVPGYPFTAQIALLAGRFDGEQQAKGVKIPFQDLLIGATAPGLSYAIVTGNPRHFQLIPKLTVIAF
ncbi:MAG: type II toxin-antitoxin system VapC family toxin [Acidobacteriia bacterium]|nr:type II toxin-antitoxin system VapC family toxin [Terriglobia bacterium]